MLGVVSLAQLLGMTLWFSATAVTPLLITEFDIAPAHAAWLTMAVQAGFVAGTLFSALSNIADILNARVLMFIGSVAGAAANAAVLIAPGGTTVIGLRFLTGASLALVYPPAMKIAAGWFRDGRGFALGLLIGALTLGKAFPHLLTALFGADWREPMLLASDLAILGGTLVVLIVRDGPFVTPTAPFDPHAIRKVLASRGARLATLGYLGHMWELYAMWTWVAVFAAASLAASGVAGASAAGSVAAFVAIGSGAVGCGLAGYVADRIGRARVAMWAMWCSARMRGADTRGLRPGAVDALRADRAVGLLGRRRFGAVLGSRQRACAARSRWHSADLADLRRFPADDGDDRIAAANGGSDELAMGIALARTRSITGCLCDETPGAQGA